MLKSLKLPFGLKDGKLVDVLSVPQGLDCGCFCPSCGTKLVAKKGAAKIHHFAHHNTKECQGAVETALHLMAKDIIFEQKKLFIPAVYLNFDEHKKTKAYEAQELPIDSVELEKSAGDIIPDLVCIAKGKKFFIEIAVTHFVDEAKLDKIRRIGASTMEINLGKMDRALSREALAHLLLSNNEQKTWIYNSKAEVIVQEIRNLAQRKQTYTRGLHPKIRYCPRNDRKYYPDADLLGDCIYCNHFVGGLEEALCTGNSKEALVALGKKYGLHNDGAGLIETMTLQEVTQEYERKRRGGGGYAT